MKRNLDHLWSRHIIDSFTKDDVKVLEKSFSSCFFDIEEVVEGGNYGTPYSIGEYAFFSENQFLHQKQSLKDLQQQLAKESNHMLLTEKDWLQIEYQVKELAYYGTHSFSNVILGDSFICLAIRKGSFKVCKRLLEYITDIRSKITDGIDEGSNHNNTIKALPSSSSSSSICNNLKILFFLNEQNESFIDILQIKFMEIISCIREIEMSIPSNSLSLHSSTSTIVSNSTLQSTSSSYSKQKQQQQQSKSVSLSLPSNSTSSWQSSSSSSSFLYSNNNTHNTHNDELSDFSHHMELFKIKQLLKLHLTDLSDITEFIHFLVEIYLPQIALILHREITELHSTLQHQGQGQGYQQQQQLDNIPQQESKFIVMSPSSSSSSSSTAAAAVLWREMHDSYYEICVELAKEGRLHLQEHSAFMHSLQDHSSHLKK